jgi:hypothetical protein
MELKASQKILPPASRENFGVSLRRRKLRVSLGAKIFERRKIRTLPEFIDRRLKRLCDVIIIVTVSE